MSTPPEGPPDAPFWYPLPMSRKPDLVSLHPLSPTDALAALLRVPPPPKVVKPAKAKRRDRTAAKKKR